MYVHIKEMPVTISTYKVEIGTKKYTLTPLNLVGEYADKLNPETPLGLRLEIIKDNGRTEKEAYTLNATVKTYLELRRELDELYEKARKPTQL